MKKGTSLYILLVCTIICTENACAEQDNFEVMGTLNESKHWKWNAQDEMRNMNSVQELNSICEELCSYGYGGPNCGDTCEHHKKIRVIKNGVDKLNKRICPTLCLNGLGFPRCDCSIASIKQIDLYRHDLVCFALCSNGLKVQGCNDECKPESAKQLNKNETIPEEETTQPTSPTTDTPTTPNWDEYCITLCRSGDGGVLCNCDKPPLM